MSPAQNDERWTHRWGFADTQFVINPDRSVTLTGQRYELCDRPLPHFLSHIEVSFGTLIDWDHPQPDTPQTTLPPPRRDADFCHALTQHFPPDIYSFEDGDRLRHSHGQSMIEEVWKVLYQTLDRLVDLVFYCQTEAQAHTLISLANQHNICLVPYGGGTSVSGALIMPSTEQRMIVAIDTRAINQVEWIDTQNHRACVQAGITGTALEAALNLQGYTCGHEPDSRELSTLGGWIATNASGMKKTATAISKILLKALPSSRPVASSAKPTPILASPPACPSKSSSSAAKGTSA